MEQLPSYQDATGKKQWLELVAPYIDSSDYQSLCCVSRQFHSHFAPRAWKDPLAVVRTLNRDTAYGERSAYLSLLAGCAPGAEGLTQLNKTTSGTRNFFPAYGT